MKNENDRLVAIYRGAVKYLHDMKPVEISDG